MVLNQERDKCRKQRMGTDSETTEVTVMCNGGICVFHVKTNGKTINTFYTPAMLALLVVKKMICDF